MKGACFYRMLWPITALIILIIGGVAAKESGWRVNVSGSLPYTFYRVTDLSRAGVGDYVQVCAPIPIPALPDAPIGKPSCNGKLPLIKRVVATAWDSVTVDDSGVWVNGALVPNSKPNAVDSTGHPLPVAYGRHDLSVMEFWLMGEHANSYDSRYFGKFTYRGHKQN